MNLTQIQQLSETEWEIPASYRQDMQVPVRLFATRRLLETALDDLSIEQAVNAASLPGLAGPVVVMPDMHQGYGFPIGGVAAFYYPDGIISPGAIGYDINCGVRLLSSSIPYEEAEPVLPALADAINRLCPSGVGVKGHVRLTSQDLELVCRNGSRWALKHGYALPEDLTRTEESGSIDGADPHAVSPRALERGLSQLGTLGSGNHFIEVDLVDQIYDEQSAHAMGIYQGCLTAQVHCGSRGLGHQVCTDYVQSFQGAMRRYSIHVPDRELVCAPVNSSEGQAYLAAMRAAANFAFANRQILVAFLRQAFEEIFAGRTANWHLRQVYDIAHNMGKVETHTVGGLQVKVCVHRKGATRAFGPGSPGLPDEYRRTGQPVLVPGSMGTASWLLAGTEKSMQVSWGSSCHGAGRLMSRSKAKKEIRGDSLKRDLEKRGIHIRAGSLPGLAEEAPDAYKDVDEVIETVVKAGIARKVARLVPLAVIKG